MRNKTVMALLALFGGSMGLQYFYQQRTGAGVACILFSWTGIPGLIGFFGGLALLVKSQADFDMEYNNGVCSDAPTLVNRLLVEEKAKKFEAAKRQTKPLADELPDF